MESSYVLWTSAEQSQALAGLVGRLGAEVGVEEALKPPEPQLGPPGVAQIQEALDSLTEFCQQSPVLAVMLEALRLPAWLAAALEARRQQLGASPGQRDEDDAGQSAARAFAEGEELYWRQFPRAPAADDVTGTIRWLLLCRAEERAADAAVAEAARGRPPSFPSEAVKAEADEIMSVSVDAEGRWARSLAKLEASWSRACSEACRDQQVWERSWASDEGLRRREIRGRAQSLGVGLKTILFCREAFLRAARFKERERWSARAAAVLSDVAFALRKAAEP